MKIYDNPIQHDVQIQDIPHISQKQDGTYIIRYTQNYQTYYYGSYTDIQEAIAIEYHLRKQDYPPRIQSTKTKNNRKKI